MKKIKIFFQLYLEEKIKIKLYEFIQTLLKLSNYSNFK